MATEAKVDVLARISNVLGSGNLNPGRWLREKLAKRRMPDLPELTFFFSQYLTDRQMAAWADLHDAGWQFHAVTEVGSQEPTVIVKAPDEDTLRVFRPDGFIDLFSDIEVDLPPLGGLDEQGEAQNRQA